jgi:hypothetical protein
MTHICPRCRRLLVLTTFLWLVATLAIHAGTSMHERAHRYDQCDLAFSGSTVVQVCPIAEFRERPPIPPRVRSNGQA